MFFSNIYIEVDQLGKTVTMTKVPINLVSKLPLPNNSTTYESQKVVELLSIRSFVSKFRETLK